MRTTITLALFLAAFGAAASGALAQNPAVTVEVDGTVAQHPISPLIYGTAVAEQAAVADLRAPLNRRGGNNTTRYNWKIDADNRGLDWYFESIPLGSGTAGGSADAFIAASRAGGAEAMMTIPIIGWVGKLGANRAKLASFSATKYGAQADCDWSWFPDACNGIRTDGSVVTGNDPNDASQLVDVQYQREWMDHLVSRWGGAAAGGLRYYILDNEYSIWHSTHRDVHPVGAWMEEVRDLMLAHAAQVKLADAAALVAGPEEWGWGGYLYSGYDLQYGSEHGWSYLPDRAAHGGADYLPWLLGQFKEQERASGQRLLDIFTVHYYPQGGEYSNDVSTAMQLRRNRSTRSLWDQSYVDESWIGTAVRLIPRLKEWVAAGYPNTPIGITEYSWGAENHINGATAQADALGIFGREGLDLANHWATPAASTPTYKAMKMYRSYDGRGSGFGDVSVRAVVPDPDTLSAFAATRSSDGALTVMVVSKALSGNTPLTIHISPFTAGATAQVWQLGTGNTIARQADVSVTASVLSTTVPSPSITLFVVPAWQTELLWRNQATGENVAWYMNGPAATWGASLPTVADVNWQISGLGDFSGDGKRDILWRNASSGENVVWFMDGRTPTGSASLWTVSDPSWRIVGVDDFDADTKLDILWRNVSTGETVVWFMNGTTPTGSASLAAVDVSWRIGGVGDFNGDGNPDIVWRNQTTGIDVVWFMDGVTAVGGEWTWTVTDVNWRIVKVGDFNSDGKPDIVWRNVSTGESVVWFMDGVTPSSGATLPTVADVNWRIVPADY